MTSKGQVAVEYMLIAAFLLVATGTIFIYSMITLDQGIKIAKADKALSVLGATADKISARGPGNTIIVEIDLPTEIISNQVTFSGKTISLSLQTPNGQNERYTQTNAELEEKTLGVSSGLNRIKVEMVNGKITFSGG